MYTATEVAAAQATVEEKLALQGYSRALQDTYGMTNYCPAFKIGCLLLLRFAILGWDARTGAVNPYSVRGLGNIIKKINAL